MRLLLLIVFFVASAANASVTSETTKRTVVKIFKTSISPDYFDPWKMLSPSNSSGTGVIIEGNRILTNAHVIADARYLQVKKYGEAEKVPAHVLFVSHDADLAIISVDDESFYKGVRPMKFGKLPKAQEQVTVLGYPFGGTSLSITQGVLSRIEHLRYAHNNQQLLAGQIDAAINPGNSGGPVIMNNRIVGIVMQSINSRRAENLGYMVPPSVISHFLEDISDGRYDGIPELSVVTQHLENKGMKKKFGFPEDKTGILVSQVFDGFNNTADLKEGDIITHVEGHRIADDHTVEFRENERTKWKYFPDQKQLGESISLEIFREGKERTISVKLDKLANDHLLVDLQEFDILPRYYVYGGIVFTPLTVNLARRWGKDWRNNAPINYMKEIDRVVTPEKQEIVVALKVLAAEINEGYHNYTNQVIESVNGQEFSSFEEFARLLQENTEEFVTFRDENGFQLVIDATAEVEANEEILGSYGINARYNLKYNRD